MILIKPALFFVFQIFNFESIHFSSGKILRELKYFSPCSQPIQLLAVEFRKDVLTIAVKISLRKRLRSTRELFKFR